MISKVAMSFTGDGRRPGSHDAGGGKEPLRMRGGRAPASTDKRRHRLLER